MTDGWRIAVIGAACLVPACARPPRPAADTASPSPPQASTEMESVTLERGPCFGTCPVYTVTLDRAGNVRFEGRRFVVNTGVATATVARAQVDSLFAELETIRYFDLADSYRTGDPGCERYATDLPTVITEVRASGRTKRVEHDRGCADAPATLSAIETRIDEVAGVRRWIGK